MEHIDYRCGAGQLRPILGECRWFRALIVEEQVFLADVRPTICDYWRSPVPLAPVVRPSNQDCITTNKQQVSPTDDFTHTARTTAERRVFNTDQTTAYALGTTHRCSVCASPRLDREGNDIRSTSAVIHTQLHRLRYIHQYSRTTRQCSPKTTA